MIIYMKNFAYAKITEFIQERILILSGFAYARDRLHRVISTNTDE